MRLREIQLYVAKDKPDAVRRLAARIVAVTEALRTHPRLGRAGDDSGIRELPIGGTPYIVLLLKGPTRHNQHNLAWSTAKAILSFNVS